MSSPAIAIRNKKNAQHSTGPCTPEGTVEATLAQNLCDAQWRLERAREAEAKILALAHYDEASAHLAAIEDPAERSAMLEAHAWDTHERTLRNIQLHESCL